jgi:hypothetical protein
MENANVGEAVVAPGMVTVAISEVGQLVSEPTGTSEYWYANCAVDDGASVTDEGAAFAGGVRETDSPLTMETVSGAPLPEKRPITG